MIPTEEYAEKRWERSLLRELSLTVIPQSSLMISVTVILALAYYMPGQAPASILRQVTADA
ncbi:MAG: hypothetical protein U5P41_11780 [Gammaproteobacteria bacterium]|nr:hypothetical protein [Gammaproteobacteria bacterium]